MSYAVHVTFLVAVAWSSFCNMLSTSGFGIGDAKECILKVTHQRQHRTGAASYSTIAFVFFCFVERYELLSEFLQSKVNEFKIYFCQVAIGRIYALHAMRPLASRQKPTVHASGNFIRLSRSLHAMHSWFEPQQSTCAMCRPTLCGPIWLWAFKPGNHWHP